MPRLSKRHFLEFPWAREPGRITIDKPGEFVLMVAARRRDEAPDSTAELNF